MARARLPLFLEHLTWRSSVAAFAVARWLGTRYVQQFVSPDIWRKLGFIVEAEGTYLFGLSHMPFWVFALISGLGRIPDTWVASAQGAHTASGDYVQVLLLTAIAVAVAVPLYYYRNRFIEWSRGREDFPHRN
jgi:uncharacterized membrane protein YdjX (TVP38/TMEM64 family)